MKRVFSWMLTLVLALTLCVPALAEESVPLWQEYGCASEAECVGLWFGGDQAAYDAEVEQRQARQQWEADMADEIAAFDPDAYWSSGQCWMADYYDSKETFMKEWLLETEEDFRACMLEDWLDNQWWDYWNAHETERLRAQLGGVAGETGIMLDGKFITFPNGKPEVTAGHTMAPCRPLLEAFGGTAAYEGDTLVCRSGDVTVRLRPGSASAEVTDASGTRTEDMGAACYTRSGDTYIPVRFLAGVLGCDVLWDSRYDAAVLVQRDKLIAQADSQFTVINRLLTALARESGKNYQTKVKLEGQLTALDSINGDKTYRLGADMEILQSGTTVELTAKFKLDGLEQMLSGIYADETTIQVWNELKDSELKVIYDGEKGMLYVKLPALELLSYGMYADGSWLAVPTATIQEMDQITSVGQLLYESVFSAYGGEYAYGDPAMMYQELEKTVEEAADYIGDGCFAKSGGYQVLHYGEEEYEAELAEIYGEDYVDWANGFEQLELELKVAESGSATFRVLVQNRDQTGFGSVVLVDAQGTITPARVNMDLLVQMKNQFDLALSYTAVTAVTDQAPAAAPGDGETVINPYEGFAGEVSPEPMEDAAA